MFNVPAIKELLDAAGLPFDIQADGTLDPYPPPNAPTAQQTTDAQAIIAAHNPAVLSKSQEIDQARAAVALIRDYLLKQIVKTSPDTPTVIVATIKAIANGNVYLNRIMTNQVAVMNSAHGWTLTLNPTTAQTRNQYIETVEIIIGLLP